MPLYPCPECRSPIASDAFTCPKCGTFDAGERAERKERDGIEAHAKRVNDFKSVMMTRQQKGEMAQARNRKTRQEKLAEKGQPSQRFEGIKVMMAIVFIILIAFGAAYLIE